jgi:hypothetical protein
MIITTPGLDYLAQHVFLPGLSLVIILQFFAWLLDFSYPICFVVLVPILGISLRSAMRTILKGRTDGLEAKRMGARLVPKHRQSRSNRSSLSMVTGCREGRRFGTLVAILLEAFANKAA